MSKKARSDATLKSLSTSQQEEVSAWLTEENLSYEDTRARLGERFGVFVRSDSTLSDFYHSVALPWKYARARNAATELAALKQGEFKPAMLMRIEQLAFEIATSNRVDVKALKSFVKMLTDSEKVELQKGTLRLAIDKFREQVKTEMEKGLDALFAEVKDNREALALYQKFKAAALKGVEDAK